MTSGSCCCIALVACVLGACRPADAPKEPTDPKDPKVLAARVPVIEAVALGASAPSAHRVAMLRLN